jgi:ribosomal protein S6
MDEAKDKKTYELALLLKSEDHLAGALTLLRQHNGEPLSEPRAKKLAFAYKIKGNTEGVFASVHFNAAQEDVKQLEHDLGTRPEIIRSMILVAAPPSEKSPTAMPPFPAARRGKAPGARITAPAEVKPAPSSPLSNEALEKKIEEILQ